MKRETAVKVAIGASLLSIGLGGCVLDDAFGQAQPSVAAPQPAALVEPASLAGPNAIPWQLTPASAASRAQGETTVVADKPGVGRIRGTEKALAQLNERIVPFAKPGKVVTACKQAFDAQARHAGAYSIEAEAAGPERKSAKGRRQQVFFRIFYADPQDGGAEVRQASVACTMGAGGRLVEASAL